MAFVVKPAAIHHGAATSRSRPGVNRNASGLGRLRAGLDDPGGDVAQLQVALLAGRLEQVEGLVRQDPVPFDQDADGLADQPVALDGLLQVGQKVPDILIADLMMPGMDGFEMIRQLRANPALSRMDIMVVSAIDREEILARGLPPDVTIFGKQIPFHEIKGFVLGRMASRQRTA